MFDNGHIFVYKKAILNQKIKKAKEMIMTPEIIAKIFPNELQH